MPISITSAFDGGNISVVTASDPADVQLEIRPEPRTPKDNNVAHYQWFCFRAAGVCGQALTLNILNAGKSSFPEAWPGYQACASYNYEEWFRVKTTYDAEAGVLAIHHTPKAVQPGGCRHWACKGAQSDPALHGQRGADLLGVVFYSFWAPYPYTRHLALVARMASAHGDLVRYVEGLLERLTSKHDPLEAVFYVVPNCNPDGSIRGHLRTNAKGANLNREWAGPTADYSPEASLRAPGSGAAVSAALAALAFAGHQWDPPSAQALQQASPDFRPSNLYGVDAPGYHGWSPQRAKQFAVAGLQALYATLLKMRELEAAGGGGAGAAGAAAAAEGGKRAAQGTAEGQGPGDKRQRTGVMGGQ
eukprot:scaffold8.g1377.t1